MVTSRYQYEWGTKITMIPNITHLQLAVISCLLRSHSDRLTAKELRAALAELGVRKDGPAFYQMMSRIEDAGMVKPVDGEKVVGGHRVKERSYELTGEGIRAWESAAEFVSVLGLATA